jgi:hypothetical protein
LQQHSLSLEGTCANRHGGTRQANNLHAFFSFLVALQDRPSWHLLSGVAVPLPRSTGKILISILISNDNTPTAILQQ